jgi:hypothetical protein
MRKRAIGVAILAGFALAGCTSPQAMPVPSTASAVPTGHATFDLAALAKSYHIAGGGKYVNGSRDVCNLAISDSILIEDEKQAFNFDGSTSVSSMTLAGGEIDYATIWPQDIVGTGITSGKGTFVVHADSAGQPVSITGRATLTWHDKATNKNSRRSDDVALTITEIPTPNYCQPSR